MSTVTATAWLGFTTTEEYRNDPQIINETIQSIARVPGCEGVYHGVQYEDPEFGHLISVWKSKEQIKSLENEEAKALLATKYAMDGETLVVDFLDDPREVFAAPITEVLIIELKPGKEKSEIAPLLSELSGIKGPGVVAATWGETDRNEGLVMIVGWDSLEAHEKAVASGNEVVGRLVGGIYSLATVKVHHVKLSSHSER